MTIEEDELQERTVSQESEGEQKLGVRLFMQDERGIGVIEIILILVENYLISYSL